MVNFWASWNEESKTMAPAYALASARAEPHIRFAKVNRDMEQDISKKYAILEVPTLLFFRGGNEVNRDYGVFDIARLLKWIKTNL
jgi:thioredoxin 2